MLPTPGGASNRTEVHPNQSQQFHWCFLPREEPCVCVCVCDSESVSGSVTFHSLQPNGFYPRQTPLSSGVSRQDYWSGLPFPFPGGLPDPGIKPKSAALQADSLPSEPPRVSMQGCLPTATSTVMTNDWKQPRFQTRRGESEYSVVQSYNEIKSN